MFGFPYNTHQTSVFWVWHFGAGLDSNNKTYPHDLPHDILTALVLNTLCRGAHHNVLCASLLLQCHIGWWVDGRPLARKEEKKGRGDAEGIWARVERWTIKRSTYTTMAEGTGVRRL